MERWYGGVVLGLRALGLWSEGVYGGLRGSMDLVDVGIQGFF